MLKSENNLTSFPDLVQAVEHAHSENKPILIYFTCYGCMSSRKFEDQIISNNEIAALIRDQFIFVQLFVDDKYAVTQQAPVLLNGKRAKNIGSIWSDFEKVLIHSVSQPDFAVVDSNLELISNKFTYRDGMPQEFKKWLEEGIEKFEAR